MRILIVDDSGAVRTRLAAMLAEVIGVEVIYEASDGSEAVALNALRAPHVIVLDLHLPRESGLTVLPRLKASSSLPLVIVLTNDASDGHRRECVRAGADFFFDKSRDFDRVVALVAERVTQRSPAATPAS